MKPKQIFILAGILIALAVLVVLKGMRPSAVVGREEAARLNIQFDPKAVTEIKLIKSLAEIQLKKAGDIWQVPSKWNAKADQQKITQLFEVLLGLRGELRSDREDLLSDYDIGNENALHIILSEGERPLVHLLVGLNRPDQRGIFLRLKDSNAVYFSNDQLLANIGLYGNIKTEAPRLDFWVDLKLIELDIDQISSLSLIKMKDGKEEGFFGFEKSSGENAAAPVWQPKGLAEGFKADDNKIKTYLRKFQFERAKEIADPALPLGFDKPDFKIVLNENGTQKTILLKKKDEKSGDFAVSVSNQSEIKLITSASASSLQADSNFFKQDEIEKAEEAKAV